MFSDLNAQKNNPLAGKDTMLLEKERQEEIIIGSKINLDIPEPNVSKLETKPLSYNPIETKFMPTFPAPAITPTPLPKPKWEKLLPNYLKFGYGRFDNPFLQLFLSNGRNDDYDWGIHVDYSSLQNQYLPNTKRSQLKLSAKTSYYLAKHTLSAQIYYNRTGYRYFADTTSDRDRLPFPDFENWLQSFGFVANLGSNFSATQKVIHNTRLNINHFSTKSNLKELSVGISPSLTIKIDDQLGIILPLSATYYKANQQFRFPSITDTSYNRIALDFQPQVRYDLTDQFRIQGGFRLSNLSFGDSSVFRFAPIAELSYLAVPDILTPYVSYSGGLIVNTLESILQENRYLYQSFNVLPGSEKLNLRIGVRGSTGQGISYDVAFHTRNVEQAVIFATPKSVDSSTWMPNLGYLIPIYEKNFKQTGFTAEFNYDSQLKTRVNAKVSYYNLKTSNLQAAFHLPALRMQFSGSYRFADKLTATIGGAFVGSRAMAYDQSTQKLITENGFLDLFTHIDYRFSKRFSVFIAANNLLNTKYYRWYGYQERPFDFKAGGAIAF
ncbi:MAG: TonB-dependent receptor [Bacteroidia bacterium]|nr:TonB-dependent receptor [Bacteroidia bacterium]